MDPDYFIWFEDVDWCYRMRAAGHRLFVLPDMQMLHAGGASFGGWSSDRRVWQFFLSLFRFLSKYRQDDLIAWSRLVIRADMIAKEGVLRVIRRIPGGSDLPLPKPETLRQLRLAIDELIEASAGGKLAAFVDRGPESAPDLRGQAPHIATRD
jgi:GT2 family glycosyltransferase